MLRGGFSSFGSAAGGAAGDGQVSAPPALRPGLEHLHHLPGLIAAAAAGAADGDVADGAGGGGGGGGGAQRESLFGALSKRALAAQEGDCRAPPPPPARHGDAAAVLRAALSPDQMRELKRILRAYKAGTLNTAAVLREAAPLLRSVPGGASLLAALMPPPTAGAGADAAAGVARREPLVGVKRSAEEAGQPKSRFHRSGPT